MPRIVWSTPQETVHRTLRQEGHAGVCRGGWRQYTIIESTFNNGWYDAAGHGWRTGGCDLAAIRQAAEAYEQRLYEKLGY